MACDKFLPHFLRAFALPQAYNVNVPTVTLWDWDALGLNGISKDLQNTRTVRYAVSVAIQCYLLFCHGVTPAMDQDACLGPWRRISTASTSSGKLDM